MNATVTISRCPSTTCFLPTVSTSVLVAPFYIALCSLLGLETAVARRQLSSNRCLASPSASSVEKNRTRLTHWPAAQIRRSQTARARALTHAHPYPISWQTEHILSPRPKPQIRGLKCPRTCTRACTHAHPAPGRSRTQTCKRREGEGPSSAGVCMSCFSSTSRVLSLV